MGMRDVALGTALLLALVGAAPAAGQVSAEASVTVASAYVWRGLTLVNRPVLQPEAILSAGPVSFGLWGNVEPFAYAGQRVISVLGGRRAPGLTEADAYLEVARSAGNVELALGALAYLYSHRAGYETDPNTAELYGRAAFPGRLPLEIAAYYDVHSVRGLYLEAAVKRPAPALPALQLALRVGGSIGETEGPESAYFQRDGVTHVEAGAALPLTVGRFSVTPAANLDLGVDPETRIVATDRSRRAKLWLSARIGWPAAED